MKTLLWVGDAACSSGFGRASHYILERLRGRWNVAVLGVNYRGDSPTDYSYPIYTAWPGGDALGVGRLKEILEKVQPHQIVFQTNPWNVPVYNGRLEKLGWKGPTVGIIASELLESIQRTGSVARRTHDSVQRDSARRGHETIFTGRSSAGTPKDWIADRAA